MHPFLADCPPIMQLSNCAKCFISPNTMKAKVQKNKLNNRNRGKIFTLGDSFDSIESLERRQPAPKKSYSHSRAINFIYHDYCQNCTLHGIQYLGQDRPWYEKLFWVLIIIISIFICSHLIYNTYLKWCETPVIVSFSEKSTPVWNIPFPAVTICSETKSIRTDTHDFTKFYNHMKTFKKSNHSYQPPANMSISDLNKMRSLLQICGNSLVKDIKFPPYKAIDFYDNLDAIVPPFQKTYPFCKFVSHYGSCENLFFKSYTEQGICYTFNGLNESEIYREDTYQYFHYQNRTSLAKRKYNVQWSLQEGYDENTGIDTFPARVLGARPRAGLFITLQDFEQDLDYICRGAADGFKVILHSPDDAPQVSRYFIRVPHKTEVVVLVKPNMITTLDGISDYEPNRRQCFFNTERHLRFFKIYTQSNCELECLTNYTLTKCGCVKFSMPRSVGTPVCDESKIHCYDLAEDDLLINEFAEGLADSKLRVRGRTKCNCLPACTSLAYSTELSQGDYNIEKLLGSHGDTKYLAENKGVKLSRLSMYFKENQFITSKRSELYGITDFVANCGGLFGLFMGFSALSAVEMVYYFTIRLMTNIQRIRRG